MAAPDVVFSSAGRGPAKESLAAKPLLHRLLEHAHQKSTGCLHVVSGENRLDIWYKDGVWRLVTCSFGENRIGQVLAGLGLVSEQDVRDAAEATRGKDLSLTQWLVEQGRLDPMKLTGGLRDQAVQRVAAAIAWRQGEVWYEDALEVPERVAPLSAGQYSILQRVFDAAVSAPRVEAWWTHACPAGNTTSIQLNCDAHLLSLLGVRGLEKLPSVIEYCRGRLDLVPQEMERHKIAGAGAIRRYLMFLQALGLAELGVSAPERARPVTRPRLAQPISAENVRETLSGEPAAPARPISASEILAPFVDSGGKPSAGSHAHPSSGEQRPPEKAHSPSAASKASGPVAPWEQIAVRPDPAPAGSPPDPHGSGGNAAGPAPEPPFGGQSPRPVSGEVTTPRFSRPVSQPRPVEASSFQPTPFRPEPVQPAPAAPPIVPEPANPQPIPVDRQKTDPVMPAAVPRPATGPCDRPPLARPSRPPANDEEASAREAALRRSSVTMRAAQPPAQETIPWPAGFPKEGALNEIPLPLVLREIMLRGRTGVLKLSQRGFDREALFVQGHLQSVISMEVIEEECLGPMLVRSGILKAADHKRTLEQAKAAGEPQGALLVREGIVSSRDLLDCLKLQNERKLLNACKRSFGRFEYHPVRPDSPPIFTTNAASFLWEAVKKYYPIDQSRNYVQSVRTRYPVPPAQEPPDLSKIKMAGFEKAFIEDLRHTPHSLELMMTRHKLGADSWSIVMAVLTLGVTDLSERPSVAAQTEAALQEFLPLEQFGAKVIHFDVLGVHWSAPRREVEAGYARQIAKLNVIEEKLRGNSAMEERIRALRKRFDEARDYLLDDNRRRSYRIDQIGLDFMRRNASMEFDRAASLLELQGNHQEARSRFEALFDMFPNQGEYRIGLGVCMSMQGEKAAAQQLIATADRKQRSEGMERMLRLIGEIK